MTSIPLQITLRSPALLAAAPPASNLLESLHFIPGNTVRGIIARRYLQVRGKADEIFREIFLSGSVKFGFAFPAGSQVIPLSARSCKYEGGFLADDYHGMLDLLLSGDKPVSCRRAGCEWPIDYSAGFWDPIHRKQVKVSTRMITRTAIDPIRASASMGKLYLQRVLEEDQSFNCSIDAPDALDSHFRQLVDNPFTAALGRGASRGQGWVEVEKKAITIPDWGLAKDRFDLFSRKCGRHVLAVTLLTDGLFRDDYLRDVSALSLSDLASLQIAPTQWKQHFVRAFMDTRTIYGFDGDPLFLPRVPRLAVAAGSAFLFEAKEDVVQPEIPEGNGVGWIGDLNCEGYGLAVLWHPFHLTPDGEQP